MILLSIAAPLLGSKSSASPRIGIIPPGLQRRPFCYAGQQHAGRLVQINSQHRIAAFPTTARPVDLTGCISSGRQSDIGSDASRSLEASGVIDRRKKAKSRDWTDARCCHEPSNLDIIASQPYQGLAVEVRNLPPDSLACLEQRLLSRQRVPAEPRPARRRARQTHSFLPGR